MIIFPSAKVNIGLNIIERRPDGYHNIETVFYPIGWRDALEVVPSSPSKSLATPPKEEGICTVSGAFVPDGDVENNLVMKALRLIENDFQLDATDIFLQKNIPFGAGLGGGSSDGACMIRLLNDYFQLGLSMQQMERYASRLGADCPFFIQNRPLFASGIGDEFEQIELDLTGYVFVVVKPDFFVPTSEAYALITPCKPQLSLKELIKLPVNEWKKYIKNDFEQPVGAHYPAIATIKRQLYEQGAVYASLSGSGSAVYGIFHTEITPSFSFPDGYIWRAF